MLMCQKGSPLDASTVEHLRALIVTMGLPAAAARLGCSPAALQRAALGLNVIAGTAALCRAGLPHDAGTRAALSGKAQA
jgi:hypothetical protein